MGQRDNYVEVETSSLHGTSVVKVSGEIDLSTVSHLYDVLSRLDATKPLSLDLQGVTFIDSTGLHFLLDASAQVRNLHLVIGRQRHIGRLLEIVGLAASFDIRPA